MTGSLAALSNVGVLSLRLLSQHGGQRFNDDIRTQCSVNVTNVVNKRWKLCLKSFP